MAKTTIVIGDKFGEGWEKQNLMNTEIYAAVELNTAKETNISTSLSEGTVTETTVDIDSSDGSNATLVAASTSRAGVLTKTKFDEIVANTAAKHTAGTDTALGTLGTKATPVDADLVIQRNSESSDVLVTSTWTQIKAFLKTYFDTLYNLYTLENHASNHTDGTDDIQNATTSQKGLLISTDWDTFNGKEASGTAAGIMSTHTTTHPAPTTRDARNATAAQGGTADTAVQPAATETLTNKRITPRVLGTTSHATPTINTDNTDIYQLTAQAEAITSFTTNLSGTPVEGDVLIIEITGTAARAITWGASFEASTVALPTTTATTAKLSVGFLYNDVSDKWRCIGVS